MDRKRTQREARIVFASDDVVSIVVEAFVNQKTAAHPSHLLFTYNYDPDTLKEIVFSDVYRIDEELYTVFSRKAEQKLLSLCNGKWPDTWGSFSEDFCSLDDFLIGMNIGNAFYYYQTETRIEISFPVPHSLGDHLEVEIPVDCLNNA